MGVIDPPVQDTLLELFDQALLLRGVCDRVSGHVKEKEVLFLGCQDPLLHKVLGDPLANVTELVLQLKGVPGLTYGTVYLMVGKTFAHHSATAF